MTTYLHPWLRSIHRLVWSCVALATLLAAVTGPASDVEMPSQPRAAVSAGAELEFPQADLTQPVALCPDRVGASFVAAADGLGAPPSPLNGPPQSPPLRPPRA